jgi:perosamine synthetase
MRRIGDLEHKYVAEVLESEFRSSKVTGMIARFESAFSKYFDSQYAISFINGTATMHATLEALGVGVGDEVIVPPLTMSATTFAVLHCNATPVFADVELDTFQLSVSSVLERITPRTKVIMPVALFGGAPELDALRSICKEKGIFLVEDNAESLGSKLSGEYVGRFGIASSFSFQSSKHLTTGEGGMVITDDEEFADELRRVQSLGYAGVSAKAGKIAKSQIQLPTYNRHVSMGWNYRMSELTAAVGLAQIERADELVAVRIESAELFTAAVQGYTDILRPQSNLIGSVNTYWTWAAVLDTDRISWEDFRELFLSKGGDPFYGAWKLSYLEPFMQERNLLGRERFISKDNLDSYTLGICPNSEFLQPRLVQLRTNYWESGESQKQAAALRATLTEIGKRA